MDECVFERFKDKSVVDSLNEFDNGSNPEKKTLYFNFWLLFNSLQSNCYAAHKHKATAMR